MAKLNMNLEVISLYSWPRDRKFEYLSPKRNWNIKKNVVTKIGSQKMIANMLDKDKSLTSMLVDGC